MPFLGVNIDHVATVRQQRRGVFPDPCEAALVAQKAGAHSIVAHLREDRRHIQDDDIHQLKESLRIPLNMEMGATEGIIAIALEARPTRVCLVPERREELTTEGGLDVIAARSRLAAALPQFAAQGIEVSLFIDPVIAQIDCAQALGAQIIELHTGRYAEAKTADDQRRELDKLETGGARAGNLGLRLHAGHGLDYTNVQPIAALPCMEELNIGFSIISRALFVGLEQAVKEMKALIA